MKKRISFILVLFFGLFAFEAQAELSIDITGARSEPMAVAMPDFAGNNEKAKELNCNDTHFTNPHGLYDENHYKTASDLIKITKYAMTLPGFTEITSKVTSDILGSDRYPLVTTNSLIDPVRGGKYYYKYAKGI